MSCSDESLKIKTKRRKASAITKEELKMDTKRNYTREELLDVMASYLRQIENDNGKHPAAVINDIEASISFVLKMNGIKIKEA